MKIIISILVLVFVNCNCLLSGDGQSTGKRNFKSIIFLTVGVPYSSGSHDFFSVYNNELSGKKKDFKLSTIIGAGTKIRFEAPVRYGIQTLLLQSSLQDAYDETVETPEQSGARYISQTINIRDIPIIFTLEYMPYVTQFRTYIGGGIGFLMRRMEWLETVRSNIPLDKRTGGTNFDATDYYPFIKIYSGVELGFDKMSDENLLGSLVLEASYNYAAGSSDFFGSVKRQFVPQEPRLNQNYNLLPGYIILSVAVTLNFNRNS